MLCISLVAFGLCPLRKKKLTLIISRAGIGGAQAHVLSLIEHFAEHYDLLLISGSTGPLIDQANAIGARTLVIPKIDSFNAFKALLALRAKLAQEQPDLVHVHSALASFYGRMATKLCGLKTLYTVHGWHFFDEPNRVSMFIKIAVEWVFQYLTNYWITVSEFDHQMGVKYGLFRACNARVIVNGIAPTQHLNQKYTTNKLVLDSTENDVFKLVFIGRIARQKNVLSALEIIECTAPSVHLTLYLSGKVSAEIVRAINSSSAQNRLTLIMNNPYAANELEQFSMMLMTSRYEGMPIVALEAMRAGLAIIATDVCGMNEVIEQGKTGILVPADQIDQIAQHINDLASEHLRDRTNGPSKVERMGAVAQENFIQYFTEEKMLERTACIYRQLLCAQ